MDRRFMDPEGIYCYLFNILLKQNSFLYLFSISISNEINLDIYAVQIIGKRCLSKKFDYFFIKKKEYSFFFAIMQKMQ